jgi:hypothetical protein
MSSKNYEERGTLCKTPLLRSMGPCITLPFNPRIPHLWGALRLHNVNFLTSRCKLSEFFKCSLFLWKMTMMELVMLNVMWLWPRCALANHLILIGCFHILEVVG